MTWPVAPLPLSVRAILLFPAGMRVFDEDLVLDYPPPMTIDLSPAVGPAQGCYGLVSRHYGGTDEARALYVLGGRYLPQGAGHPQLLPDEVHDQ